jgi:uncharacterized protein (UPF0332 family)
VKPEASAFLEKAKELLDRASELLAQSFTDDAGRSPYLAGFHTAQALIFEMQGRSPKSHSGVQSQFAVLARNEPVIDRDLRAFLGRTYNLKAIADYGTGPGSKVTVAQATGDRSRPPLCCRDRRADTGCACAV